MTRTSASHKVTVTFLILEASWQRVRGIIRDWGRR